MEKSMYQNYELLPTTNSNIDCNNQYFIVENDTLLGKFY